MHEVAKTVEANLANLIAFPTREEEVATVLTGFRKSRHYRIVVERWVDPTLNG